MELFPILVFLTAINFNGVKMDVDRNEIGYSRGLLAVCPGSEKPAKIPKKRLNHLKFVVLGKERHYYPYFQAVRGIASDTQVDFNNKETVIFISGWIDFTQSPIMTLMGAAYMRKNKYNVILLETGYFTQMQYPIAARLTRDVGRRIAIILAGLTKYGLDPKRVQIIGLSLGGQTISYIGKNFQNITGGIKIGRLTALDPAGPCFRYLPRDQRLTETDADRIDVIHTNVDGFGMPQPMGHVDIYVNGAEFQPNNIEAIPCTSMCSHLHSYTYWLGALDHPDEFIAMKCNSVQEARNEDCYKNKPLVTNVLGPKTDFSKPGIFYLATGNRFPYYLGTKGLKEANNVVKSFVSGLNIGDVTL